MANKRIKSGLPYEIGGYIYFIQCGKYFKVGRTQRMGSRMTNYKGSNPYDVNLLLFVNRPDYKTLEKKIHERFKDFVHKCEWFVLNDRQVEEVMEMMQTNG